MHTTIHNRTALQDSLWLAFSKDSFTWRLLHKNAFSRSSYCRSWSSFREPLSECLFEYLSKKLLPGHCGSLQFFRNFRCIADMQNLQHSNLEALIGRPIKRFTRSNSMIFKILCRWFSVNFIVDFVGSALLILLVDCSYSLRLVSCDSELELLILPLIVMVALCLLLLTSTRGNSRWLTMIHDDLRWLMMTYTVSLTVAHDNLKIYMNQTIRTPSFHAYQLINLPLLIFFTVGSRVGGIENVWNLEFPNWNRKFRYDTVAVRLTNLVYTAWLCKSQCLEHD